MERGRLIVIEGTDCSGKETQTNLLVAKLMKDGYSVKRFSYPMYDTPTGKIVGGPYLGKSCICDGWFPEKAPNVDPKVSSLYYAADRKYNMSKIEDELSNGTIVILDRYIYSNMAHQGGKIFDKEARYEMYNWLDELEFNLLELNKPDICIFLHMPNEAAKILKKNRSEKPDQNESDENHLINAEKSFIEVANKYNFKTIECVRENVNEITIESIKTIEEINQLVYDYVTNLIIKEDNKIKDL